MYSRRPLCKYRQAPCERLRNIFSPDKMNKNVMGYNGILCIMFKMNKKSVHTDVKNEVYNMR